MSHIVHVAIMDHGGTGVSAGELHHVALALQKQVNQDFGIAPPHGYGCSVSIRVADALHPPHHDDWLLGLFAEPDQPGALGYHDVTPAGLPLMKVFPLLDAQDGVPWPITASHELLETLADPLVMRCVQAPDGRVWALEVCDGVEADAYAISPGIGLPTIPVSNFALPTYFEPPAELAGVKFDHLGLVTVPFEIRPGGYNQWWDGSSWQLEVHAEKSPRAARLAELGGRKHRRQARAR